MKLRPVEQDQFDFQEYEQHLDSIEKYLTKDKVVNTSKAHNLVFGTHHRDLYLEKYSFMRWSNSWMFVGLWSLLKEKNNKIDA